MAINMDGLFTSPEQIRGNRIDQLMQQSEQRKQMSLLNQVAAGRGAQLAESVAGMFGLQSPEEKKAAEVQKIMATLKDTDDPNAYLGAAKRLNEMGFTKEAIFVMDRGRRMKSENAAEARAAAAEGRAAELFPLQKQGAQVNIDTALATEARAAALAPYQLDAARLGVTGKRNEILTAQQARVREAKVDSVLSGIPMGADPAAYYLQAGQALSSAGLREEAAELYKSYATLAKDGKAGVEGRFTAIDNQTGEFVRLADTQDGKLVQITDRGLVPYTGKFRNPVQLTGDPMADKLALTKEARSAFDPIATLLRQADLAFEFGEQALVDSEAAAKMEPQLNRFLTTLAGDKQLSLAEVEYAVSQANLPTRIADSVSKLLKGTTTEGSIQAKLAAISVARDMLREKLQNGVKSFDANFGDQGINIDQYRIDAFGVSANASQYIK